MDEFDRDRPSRSGDPYGRRRDSRQERPARDSIRRRPDYEELPEFDRGSRRRLGQRSEDFEEPETRPRRSTRPPVDDGEAPRRERYSDRFRRQPRYEEEEADARSVRSSRDPYDRLRRVGNRPARRVETESETDYEFDAYRDEDLDAVAPGGRVRRRPTRREAPRIDQQRLRNVSAAFANPAPEVRPLMMGGLAAVASLVLLSILVLVKSGSMPDLIPLHLNAEGTTTVFGTKGSIWRLPFFALLTTLMAFGLGWWLRTRDSFAVQYLVVGALMIHCLIWVGAINLLW
jgi:hypothetical protein